MPIIGSSASPKGVPTAPTIGTATAGDASASVTFTAPSFSKLPITSYTVTASPGGATGTGSSSPITVSGLSNGTAYTFTVRASHANGQSAASSASNSASPAQPTYALSQTFNASGNYTVPASMTKIAVYGWGGGGAGGSTGSQYQGAGGGGGGGFAFQEYSVTPGQNFVVTIGAGGNRNGTRNAGTTYFSSLGTADGGTAGSANSHTSAGSGGGGSSGVSGAVTSNGGNGGAQGGAGGAASSLTLNAAGLGSVTRGGGGGAGGAQTNAISDGDATDPGQSGTAGGSPNGGTGGQSYTSQTFSYGVTSASQGATGGAGGTAGGGGGGGGGGYALRPSGGSAGPYNSGAGGNGGSGQILVYVR